MKQTGTSGPYSGARAAVDHLGAFGRDDTLYLGLSGIDGHRDVGSPSVREYRTQPLDLDFRWDFRSVRIAGLCAELDDVWTIIPELKGMPYAGIRGKIEPVIRE